MNKFMAWLSGAVIVGCLGYYSLIQYVLPRALEEAVPMLEQTAAEYINGSVRVGQVTWKGGTTLTLKDVSVLDAGKKNLAVLPETNVTISPLMALKDKTRAVSEVALLRPTLYISEGADAKWNLQNFLKPSDSETTPFYGLATIKEGAVVLAMPEGTWKFGVEGRANAAGNPNFALDFVVSQGLAKAKLTGKITTKGIGDLYLKSDRVPLEPYAALAVKYGQVQQAAGSLTNIDLHWQGGNAATNLSGSTRLEQVSGTYTLESGAPLEAKLNGDVEFDDNKVIVHNMHTGINGQEGVLEGQVDFRDPDNLQGSGLLEADSLSYGGQSIRKLSLPVSIVNGIVAVKEARLEYGGGQVKAVGTYNLKNGYLAAVVDVAKAQVEGYELGGEPIVLNGSFGAKGTVNSDKTDLNVVANTADLTWKQLKAQVLAFDAQVNDTCVDINNFSAFAGPGAIEAKGKVTFDQVFNIEGRFSNVPLEPILALAGEEGTGLASSSFKLYGSAEDVNFDGMTQVQSANLRGFAIDEAHGMAKMAGNVLTLTDYKVNLPQGQHLLNGSVDLNGAEPVLDLRVNTEGVRAEPMVALVGDYQLTGNIDNRLLVRGPISKPLVKGRLHFTDGSAMGYLIDEISGDYEYDRGAVTLKNFVVKALSTTLLLSGRMDENRQLNFVADATNVDLERLPIKDETVALQGYASIKGYLRGTVDKPYFEGDVHSDSFFVNGEKILNLVGALKTDGRRVNILKGSCEQKSTFDEMPAVYAVDLDLDIPERYLKGSIGVVYGNLQSILKMAKLDYPIDGLVQGMVYFNKAGKGSGMDIDADIFEGKVHDLKYEHMALKGHMKDRVLHLDKVRLQEKESVEDKGFIAVGGDVDFKQRTCKLEAGAVGINPAIITALMADPVSISGDLNAAVQLEGSLDRPNGNGSIEFTSGTIAGVELDKAVAMVILKDDNLHLEQLLASREPYRVKASGDVPLDLFRSKAQRHNPNAQMDIRLDLSEASLGVLSSVKAVEWGMGDLNGDLRLSGTLEEPMVHGELKVVDGALKLKDITTLLDKINVDVKFDGNRVVVNSISTQLGKGKLSGTGTYALRASEGQAYKVNLTATNAELASSIFTGRLNGTAAIEPARYRIMPKPGQPSATVPEYGYRPKVTVDLTLDDVLVNMPVVPELGEGQSNIGLDVSLKLGPKIHLYNKYLYDLWLSGGLNIKGSTLFPVIEGSIAADRGNVTYLRTDFKMQEAKLSWITPGSFLPNVHLLAKTKFSSYNINMAIDGAVEQMEMKLTSEPALSRDKIVRMLTLQRVSAGSDAVTNEDLQNLLSAGLQTAVLGDVEQFVRDTLGIDQFKVYMGKVENGVDFDTSSHVRELTPEERSQYNVLLSKNINDRLMVGYTSSLNGMYNDWFAQYSLSKHMNFTVSQNEKAERRYSLEYRVGFR